MKSKIGYLIGFWLSVPISTLLGMDISGCLPVVIGGTAMWIMLNISVTVKIRG